MEFKIRRLKHLVCYPNVIRRSFMGYKEAIEAKFTGQTNELVRLRETWTEIVNAFEKGGEDSVKSVLNGRADKITDEFMELLEQLRKKL
jgi:alpha-glucuronidase